MTELESKTRIIEKAIESKLSPSVTREFICLLGGKDYLKIFETYIGELASTTGKFKTVMARCSQLNITTIGDLYRLGGKAFRECPDVGAKTAAIISDALERNYGITDWFSKEKTE